MGCGASHNDVIKNVLPKNPSDKNQEANGHANSKEALNNSTPKELNSHSKNSSIGSEASTIPANEFYQNFSSNYDMNVRLGPLPNSLPPLKPPRASKVGFLDQNTNDTMAVNKNGRGVPVAFEVPAAEGEEEGGSIIRKHPPRRLRRMDDQSPAAESLTQEVLDEKVQQANQRRTQVLHQRVASARQKSARVGTRVRTLPVFENEGDEGVQPK